MGGSAVLDTPAEQGQLERRHVPRPFVRPDVGDGLHDD
jgi:hypothetical protein